jgi:hypothetical protein
VTHLPGGAKLGVFPRAAAIELVENYIFAVRHATLADLRDEVRQWNVLASDLAVVMFAVEYRPGSASVHRGVAELCFSRTGIARSGTENPCYNEEARGYAPLDGGQTRVVPARFAPYLAVRVLGDRGRFGPMNFNIGRELADSMPDLFAVRFHDWGDDRNREFWVPLHKLFSGAECLYQPNGTPLGLEISCKSKLINEKLARVFKSVEAHINEGISQLPSEEAQLTQEREQLAQKQAQLEEQQWQNEVANLESKFEKWNQRRMTWEPKGDSWPKDTDLAGSPFTLVDEQLAKKQETALGSCLLVPIHAPLVRKAEWNGQPLALWVPPAANYEENRRLGALRTKVFTRQVTALGQTFPVTYRLNPGYVNIRHQVVDGEVRDLNKSNPTLRGLLETLGSGGYWAQMYHDGTADGWVKAKVEGSPELADLKSIAAYAVIAPPDFVPGVSQRELMEWSRDREIARIWFVPPLALSDARVAANVTFREPDTDNKTVFDINDTTVTAIVSMPRSADTPIPTELPAAAGELVSRCLPDDAAGVFSPGWDIGITLLAEDLLEEEKRKKANDPQAKDYVLREHLASFTLGSPFPEDAKLCAALSSYWPAVAPDVSRVYLPIQPDGNDPEKKKVVVVQDYLPAVIPVTDAEAGGLDAHRKQLPGWDGIVGPFIEPDSKDPRKIRYPSPIHADYVTQAEHGWFNFQVMERTSEADYKAIVLAMNRVYRAVGIEPPIRPFDNDEHGLDPRARWRVLSFLQIPETDPKRLAALRVASLPVASGPVFRVELYQPGAVTEKAPDADHALTTYLVEILHDRLVTCYVDSEHVAFG